MMRALALVALLLLPATADAQWLGAECQPALASTQAQVDALRAVLASVPAHRVAAAVETPGVRLDAEAIALAAAAADGGEVAALVTWLRWVAPEAVADVELPDRADCTADGVALLASLPQLDREAVNALLPLVRAWYATHAVPESATRRLATHAYLATHAPLLEALADGEQAQRRADDQTHIAVRALALGARGRGGEMLTASEPLAPEDPWRQWVRAEAFRQTDAWEAAAELCETALTADPLFAAAIFTRAAVRIRTGAAEMTLSDVEHLRRAYGPDGPYHEWTDRLDSRQRR